MGIVTTPAKDVMGLLASPNKTFRLFRYDDAKYSTWSNHLLNDELHVSDEHRNEKYITMMLENILFGPGLSIVYEIGCLAGILAFLDVIPGFKCALTWQFWDKSAWSKGGKSGVRDARELIEYIMDEFDLVRIGTRTADPRVVKLAKILGFEIEGLAKNDFKWGGKLYDIHIMGMTRMGG